MGQHIKGISERYLGNFTTANLPTVAKLVTLEAGDLAYDTTTSSLKVFSGTAWAAVGGGGPASVAWGDVSGKPAVIAAGADVAAARTAIGAGTSSLAVATTTPAALAAAAAVGTGTTAARADHVHAIPGASVGAVRGTVLIAAAQANSTATDAAGLVTDFNALLAKLRTAGVIAP